MFGRIREKIRDEQWEGDLENLEFMLEDFIHYRAHYERLLAPKEVPTLFAFGRFGTPSSPRESPSPAASQASPAAAARTGNVSDAAGIDDMQDMGVKSAAAQAQPSASRDDDKTDEEPARRESAGKVGSPRSAPMTLEEDSHDVVRDHAAVTGELVKEPDAPGEWISARRRQY
jgi:hypothetical protein